MSFTLDSKGSLTPRMAISNRQPAPTPNSNKNFIPVTETRTWEGSFNINPEDRSLAVVTQSDSDLDSMPDRFLEIYYRFQRLGWDFELGDKCIMMAYTLRKIMVLHGFSAHVQEVVSEYRNARRQWAMMIGSEHSKQQGLKTHAVVLSGEWILDYAQLPIHWAFGSLAPRAIVARRRYDTWQDLGFFGQIRYVKKDLPNEETLNQRILQRPDVVDLVRHYFAYYRAG